jgi:predicted metalloprotease with PDZ domain
VNLRRSLAPLLLVFFCGVSLSQTPVSYTVSLTDPQRHLVKISIELPPGRDTHELQLPVWNALYQVRDFSQNMNWIRATKEDPSGEPVVLTQMNPSRWKITGAEHGAGVEYEMFTDSPGSFGAQLNPHHAFLNLAQILLYADDTRNRPVQVEFRDLPARWKIATPLAQSGEVYTAQNYDQLVDSPVEAGTFEENDFSATCGTYRVIFDSDSRVITDPQATLQRLIPPLRRIASTAAQWMNDCPFQAYMFIFHASDSPGSGGMEHAYSTAISLNQEDFTGDLDHFTAVTAHEFFHLWNVKRIRPQSLEPIDYTRENDTPALWFSEGVDTAASEQIRLRAGLIDERHYLDHLGEAITALESRPAHLTQSVEQSSLDAWLEKYPRYDLPERSISYYNKGELLGVLLDLAMRDASHDQASLRDLFRAMNDHYAKQGRFFGDSQAIEQEAETLSHADLRAFFERYVSGTEEIPWDSFFASVGLRVMKADVTLADPEFEATRIFDQPLTVQQVSPGSDAQRAGLKPDDVILEINHQAPQRDFGIQIAALAPGATLELTVSRNGAQHTLLWKLSSRTFSIFRLQDVPDVSALQKSERAAWLFDRGENPAPAGNPAPNSNP